MVLVRRHARHWRSYLASGGLVLIVCSIRAAASSDPPAPAPRQQNGAPQEQATPAESQPAPNQRGTVGHPLVVQALPSPQTQEEAKRDAEKEFRDTASEWGTLVIAGLTLVVLLLQLVVFGIQARRLKQTVETMKTIDEGQATKIQASIAQASRAAEATEKLAIASASAAEAAHKSAMAALDQADIAKAVFLASNRPWLVVERQTQDFDQQWTLNPTFSYWLVNYGTSPAIIRSFCDTVVILNRRVQEADINDLIPFLPPFTIILPNDRKDFTATYFQPALMSEARDPFRLNVYAFGEAVYEGLNGLECAKVLLELRCPE